MVHLGLFGLKNFAKTKFTIEGLVKKQFVKSHRKVSWIIGFLGYWFNAL